MDYLSDFRYRGSEVRVFAGKDALSNLKPEVERAGAKRAFVVCGQTVAHRTDLLVRLREALGEVYAGVFDGVQARSPLPSVLEGVQAARRANADLIVAVGGGSAIVTARAITILLAEGEDIHKLVTQYPPGRPPVSPRLLKPKLPNVIVLTTPTSAMNRAGTAVLDPGRSHRLELFDPKTRPVAIILDGQALLTAPVSLALSAAVACLGDAVMGLAAALPHPMGDADSLQVWRLLSAYLPRLVREPTSPDVRVMLATAAFLTNRSNDAEGGAAPFGVIRALAHCLVARYPQVSHGAGYSIVTVPGLRFNLEQTLPGQGRLAEALGVRRSGMSDAEAARAAHAHIEELLRSVEMPLRLSQVGVPPEACDMVAGDAVTDFFLHRNARKVQSAGELAEVLRGVA